MPSSPRQWLLKAWCILAHETIACMPLMTEQVRSYGAIPLGAVFTLRQQLLMMWCMSALLIQRSTLWKQGLVFRCGASPPGAPLNPLLRLQMASSTSAHGITPCTHSMLLQALKYGHTLLETESVPRRQLPMEWSISVRKTICSMPLMLAQARSSGAIQPGISFSLRQQLPMVLSALVRMTASCMSLMPGQVANCGATLQVPPSFPHL